MRSALEAERARIARDLHDELSQVLLSAQLDVLWLQQYLAGKDSRAEACLAQLLDEIREVAKRMRDVAERLRPAALDEHGLHAAVRWLVRKFEPRVDFAIEVESAGALERLDEDVAVNVFRIVQEALTNAAKHARCGAVTIRLHRSEDELELEVIDDGVGLSPRANDHPGYGIRGMRERAHALGGALVLERAESGGTRLRLRVPLAVEA